MPRPPLPALLRPGDPRKPFACFLLQPLPTSLRPNDLLYTPFTHPPILSKLPPCNPSSKLLDEPNPLQLRPSRRSLRNRTDNAVKNRFMAICKKAEREKDKGKAASRRNPGQASSSASQAGKRARVSRRDRRNRRVAAERISCRRSTFAPEFEISAHTARDVDSMFPGGRAAI